MFSKSKLVCYFVMKSFYVILFLNVSFIRDWFVSPLVTESCVFPSRSSGQRSKLGKVRIFQCRLIFRKLVQYNLLTSNATYLALCHNFTPTYLPLDHTSGFWKVWISLFKLSAQFGVILIFLMPLTVSMLYWWIC